MLKFHCVHVECFVTLTVGLLLSFLVLGAAESSLKSSFPPLWDLSYKNLLVKHMHIGVILGKKFPKFLILVALVELTQTWSRLFPQALQKQLHLLERSDGSDASTGSRDGKGKAVVSPSLPVGDGGQHAENEGHWVGIRIFCKCNSSDISCCWGWVRWIEK